MIIIEELWRRLETSSFAFTEDAVGNGNTYNVEIYCLVPPFQQVWGIPCRIVYFTGIPEDGILFPTARRYGVQFLDLAERKMDELELLIQRHTVNCAASMAR